MEISTLPSPHLMDFPKTFISSRRFHKPTDWAFKKIRKYADYGVSRSVHPRETVKSVSLIMPKIGVTRVGDITRLDRVGIPNYVSVRPCDAEPGISFYNGKGFTRVDAQAGAMMEAIERYSGEACDYPVIRCSYNKIHKFGAAIDPDEIVIPSVYEYDHAQEIEWVQGFDLVSNSKKYLPLNSVVCPYRSKNCKTIYFASSNGLASGNCIEEAVCHALCEIIERDSVAISYTHLKLAPAIEHVMKSIGRKCKSRHNKSNRLAPLVHLGSLPKRARILVARLERAGIQAFIRSFSKVSGIPTFECIIADKGARSSTTTFSGHGTHPDARIAVTRAITEAAQSRLTTIQGGREDLPVIMPQEYSIEPNSLFGKGVYISYEDVRSYENEYLDEDIKLLVDKLSSIGLDKIVAVDLTRPETGGVPVVRIVIPKAETWPVFQIHLKRGVFGTRVSKLLSSL